MATEKIEVKGKEVRVGDTIFGNEVTRAAAAETPAGHFSLFFGGNHLWIDADERYTVEREKPVDPLNTIRRNAATGQVFRKHLNGAWYKTGHQYSYLPDDIEVEGFDVIWSPEGD